MKMNGWVSFGGDGEGDDSSDTPAQEQGNDGSDSADTSNQGTGSE